MVQAFHPEHSPPPKMALGGHVPASPLVAGETEAALPAGVTPPRPAPRGAVRTSTVADEDLDLDEEELSG